MRVTYSADPIPASHEAIIAVANEILAVRRSEGFPSMTLREVYYQFISWDRFPDDRCWLWIEAKRTWLRDKDGSLPGSTKNAQPNYKWLGAILVKARLAGMIDWNAMVDNLRSASIRGDGWESVPHYAESIGTDYGRRTWEAQPTWMEVWVEKDAQVGIVDSIVRQWRISSFACRGNVSSSAIYQAARRHAEKIEGGKPVIVFHLGDHDPNGIDMSRDNEDRLTRMILVNLGLSPEDVDEAIEYGSLDDTWEQIAEDFGTGEDEDGVPYKPFLFRRIGLNMDQILEFNPPPSPAKLTDSRSTSYIDLFGRDSWELDALSPAAMREIITENVLAFFDADAFAAIVAAERDERDTLAEIPERWDEIAAFLAETRED